jgi:hypothetical protein
MKSIFLATLLTWGSLLNVAAVACSCPPPGSIQAALRHSTLVVLAHAISIEQHPIPGDSVSETATFKVLESWKGPYRRGATLPIRSDIGPGPCGMSARNDPPWLDGIDPATHATTHPHISGLWIIYAAGQKPYQISMCSRSTPYEYGGKAEMKMLYRLKFGTLSPSNRDVLEGAPLAPRRRAPAIAPTGSDDEPHKVR